MALDTDDSNRRNRNRSWWQRRTGMERKLITLFVLAIIIIIALIVGIAVLAAKSSARGNICLTETCIGESHDLLHSMNLSVDPCDDFYEFACGRYVSETELAENEAENTGLINIMHTINKKLKVLLEEPVEQDDFESIAQLKHFYKNCTDNVQAIEDDNLQSFTSLMSALGGWPMLNPDAPVTMDWKDITYRFRQLGLPANQFMTFRVDYDVHNESKRAVVIDQPEFEVPAQSWQAGLQDPNVQGIRMVLVNLATRLGVEQRFAEKEVDDVMAFRVKISEAAQSDPERKELAIATRAFTITELQKKAYTIPWMELVNNVMYLPERTLWVNETVFVPGYQYVTALDYQLTKTPKRVQLNHAFFHLLRFLLPYLPQSLRETNDAVFGASVRWQKCMEFATDALQIATGSLYVKHHFDDESRKVTTELVNNVKNEMLKVIDTAKWMDPKTKERATEKLKSTQIAAGYPNEVLDKSKMDEYHSGLKFNSDNILDMVQALYKFKFDKTRELLLVPTNKSDWRSAPPLASLVAAFEFQANVIYIPAGIVQGLVFNKNRPQYMNYAGMGLIAGHEICHCFDSVGKTFDKHGVYRNWWEPDTEKAFQEKAQCYMEQYGNYTVPEIGMKVNAKNTLPENIADNGGMKQAYLAYKEWLRHNKAEPTLPGLKYNQNQLFWIAAARPWCAKTSLAGLQYKLLQDEHSPERFRIIGSFRNLDEFAKDFNCPVGSKMNPKEKCRLW